MRFIILALILISTSCSTMQKPEQAPTLQITELIPDKRSSLMTQNIVHLSKVYDLNPYIYSKNINIQSGVSSKHYPTITLNTRFADNPNKLLSVFLHEQFHWWLIKNAVKSKKVMTSLKELYPNNKDLAHIIVCYLEHRTLVALLGKSIADKVIYDFIHKDKILSWYNDQVLRQEQAIRKIIVINGLMPMGLN